MQAHGFTLLMAAVLIPAASWACWSDFRRHRVPNALNLALAGMGLVAQACYFGPRGVSTALLGMATGFGLLIVLWLMHAMGAGDVKYMTALGAWLGPQMTLYAVVVGGLLGGVLALIVIVWRRSWTQTSMNLGVLMAKVGSLRSAFSEFGSAASLAQGSVKLPYAIPLSLGTLAVLASNLNGW